jgi:hypothetical protein
MQNVTMLAMQFVLLDMVVSETIISIQNAVHIVHQHGPVQQTPLEQMNNVEV